MQFLAKPSGSRTSLVYRRWTARGCLLTFVQYGETANVVSHILYKMCKVSILRHSNRTLYFQHAIIWTSHLDAAEASRAVSQDFNAFDPM